MENYIWFAALGSVCIMAIITGWKKNWEGRIYFFLGLPMMWISKAFLEFTVECWKFNGLGNLSIQYMTSACQIQIVPFMAVSFLLVSLVMVLFCAGEKEGVWRLYCINDAENNPGILMGVCTGFFLTIIIGLVFGFISWMLYLSFMLGFLWGLSLGFPMMLILVFDGARDELRGR